MTGTKNLDSKYYHEKLNQMNIDRKASTLHYPQNIKKLIFKKPKDDFKLPSDFKYEDPLDILGNFKIQKKIDQEVNIFPKKRSQKAKPDFNLIRSINSPSGTIKQEKSVFEPLQMPEEIKYIF